ncbi:MAG: hypothetical protein IJF33_03845 [Clostridia bacterium]|nr:hypothetical protein [Clostridia bacterium]
MYENNRYSYLEDGQSAPRIADWQRRLSESSEAVLSVLSDAMKKLSVGELTDEWNTLHASLLQEHDALLTILADAATQIPLPKGFFVGDAERAPAYRTVCRLFGVLEARVQKLRLSSLMLSQKNARLAKQKRNADRVKLALWEIEQAAKNLRQVHVIEAVEGFRAELTQTQKNTAKLFAAVEKAEQALMTLCSSTLPDFCTRMYTAADMDHNGAACNPAAAVRLCSELRTVLQTLSF